MNRGTRMQRVLPFPSRAAWVVLLGLVVGTPRVCAGQAPAPARPLLRLKVRLECKDKPSLKRSDVSFALFPSGKRCAFTYSGPSSYRTIEALSKLGFRTTVYCSPASSTERIQDLEESGADVGVRVWGGKGTYSSHIGANTIQEAFDAVATSRIVLRKKADGLVAVGSIGGHYSTRRFPVDRNPDSGSGFGYAYHDSNYLLLSDNKPYMIYLSREQIGPGRPRSTVLASRENHDNRLNSRRVPNETIYYHIMANQFRGTLRRAKRGQIVRFSLRDFKTPDLAELASVLGKFGKHELVWHASETMIGANEYAHRKVSVEDVSPADGNAVTVTLAVERDTFPPFLLTPLPLKLPRSVAIKAATCTGVPCPTSSNEDGVYVNVPLRAVLTGPLKMSLEPDRPDMTIPDEMAVALNVRNTSAKPVRIARLEWVTSPGLTVTGGEKPFDLAAGAGRTIQATAKTVSGARFGFVPLAAALTTADGRTLAEGFELIAAPRLRVEVDPMQRIPLAKGREQHFFVHINNRRSNRPDGPPDTFISHRAGPCKGVVGFDLPTGMHAVPKEQPFQLGTHESKTLIFKIVNTQYSSEKNEMIKPLIRFDGEKEAVNVLFPGTIVVRSEARVAPKPLDDKGLLVYASWDDKTKGANYDRAAGSTRCGQSGAPCIYSNEGVKGWCLSARSAALADSFKNIDYQQGTILCWVRKDPAIRNENTYVPDPAVTCKVGTSQWNNRGECLFGMSGFSQIAARSQSGITLRRYRSWKGKTGYLQVTYQGMGHQIHYAQAPFLWVETWRHLATLWDIKARRLELYIDGKLACKADPGKAEWYGAPWDRGRPSGESFSPISCDHGKWTGTQRDELYIYNRPLTLREIVYNMNLARKP